jgi:hypothetical protein
MIAQGAIMGVVLGGLLIVAVGQQRPPPPPAAAPAMHAANDREAWALDFLAALGNTRPSAATVGMVVEWTLAEDAGPGAFSRNNPLNTTQPGYHETTTINSDGVKGYQTRQDGLQATIRTITNGRYDPVVAALLANDPDAAKVALWSSPWAGSHYGYGASWPSYTTTTAAPAARAVGDPHLLQGAVGTNVLAALNANGGAIQAFTIPPGGTWSFGHGIAPIAALGPLPVVCGPAGCYAGGGWCDLSALYVRVADQLGLTSRFPAHDGVADPRFPGILLDDNGDGGDLTIHNPTDRAVTFQTRVDGDRLVIEGGFQ